MWIGGLFKLAAAKLQPCTRRGYMWEGEDWRAVVVVLPGIHCGLWIAFIVVLELSQSGHGKNSKAGADDRLVVLERTVSNADTRIEVAQIGLP